MTPHDALARLVAAVEKHEAVTRYPGIADALTAARAVLGAESDTPENLERVARAIAEAPYLPVSRDEQCRVLARAALAALRGDR